MNMKNLPAFMICLSLLTTGLMRQPLQPAQPALTNIIYSDSLVPGWDNWSWGDTLNFAATSPVHSGSHGIAINLDPWGALSLHNPGIDTLGTTTLQFFMNGGSAGGEKIDVFFNLEVNGQTVNGPVFHVPPPGANAWEEVDAPLSTLNPAGAVVTRINWQSALNSSQSFYFDDISFTSPVDPNAPTLANGSLTPRSIPADGLATLVVKVKVADPQGAGDIASVTLDASALGRGVFTLADDGRSNDGQANDGLYGTTLTVAPSTAPGEVKLGVTATDKEGHANFLPLGALTVLGAPGGAIPAVLPQHFGWGSDAWNETPGLDWQVNSGVPWNYVYQYITQGWETWGTPDFVSRFVQHAWTNHYVPIVTVYMILGIVAGGNENSAYYASQLQNASKVQAYLASLQRAAQQSAGSKPVIFNIEPDFYGYMQQLSNSSNHPAGVVANNPASYPVALNISGYANTLAGFGQYLVHMIHATAPNALVAPMASMWATNMDPQSVTADQAIQMGQSTANFIDAMGGDQADALIVEWSDRDAGDPTPPQRPWWDDQDMKLPRPTRATLWENALSRQAGKRLILWQIPVGNMAMDNSCHHYQDNRAAYAFSHTRDLFDAGVIGLVFGGGAGCETSVETDGGFVAAQGAIAYAAPAAPTGLAAGVVLGGVVPLRWNENSEPDLWGYQVVYQRALGGQVWLVDARRKNALALFLPIAGDWKIGVRAYDAMGNLSPETAQVTVTSLANAEQLFLPLALH